MKTCPNCGSILADNEPYCENCGFDPDFDMGIWNNGRYNSLNKPYLHGEHIKSSQYVISKEVDWAFFIVAWCILLGVLFMFCIVPFLLDIWKYNYQTITYLFYVVVFIACICVIYKVYNTYNKKKINKKQEKNLNYDSQNSKYIVCMECGYENPKNLSRCKKCESDLIKSNSNEYEKTAEKLILKLDNESINILKNFKFNDCIASNKEIILNLLKYMSSEDILKLIDRQKEYYELLESNGINKQYKVKLKGNSFNDDRFITKFESIPHEQLLKIYFDEISYWGDDYNVDITKKRDIQYYFYMNYTLNEINELFSI